MHIRSFEESLDEVHEYVDNYTDQLRINQKKKKNGTLILIQPIFPNNLHIL